MENVLSQRVKELRKMYKLSQTEFGKRLDVTHTTISRVESGENISMDLLYRICKEFDIEVSNLLGGDGIFRDGTPDITTKSDSTMVQELIKQVNEQKQEIEHLRAQLEKKEKQLDMFIEKYVKAEVTDLKPHTDIEETPVLKFPTPIDFETTHVLELHVVNKEMVANYR